MAVNIMPAVAQNPMATPKGNSIDRKVRNWIVIGVAFWTEMTAMAATQSPGIRPTKSLFMI